MTDEGNSFKSGSGNLNFGDDDSDSEESQDDAPDFVDEGDSDESTTERQDDLGRRETESSATTTSRRGTERSGTSTGGSSHTYPYYIRRSKVMDERVNRLEVHVRDEVKEREGQFRSELADILGTDEVKKTDAREAAQLAAYENPEIVAQLMEDEGYGELD